MVYPSTRLYTASANDGAFCVVAIEQIDEIIVGIGGMQCCIKESDFCFGENTDVTIRFRAPATSDFSTISEAYFTLYSDRNLATQVFQKTLTGGGISQPSDYEFSVPLDSATDTAQTPGRYYWETALETAGGGQKVTGQGVVKIINTGTFD